MSQSKGTLLEQCVEQVRQEMGDRLQNLTVDRAVLGLFFSGVKLSSGYGGVCFTPVKEMPEAVCCPSSARAMPYAGRLAPRAVTQYLEELFEGNPLKRALGIAVLNALSAELIQTKKRPYQYGGAFDSLPISRETRAVVVGALVPAMHRLRRMHAQWTVLEQDPATLKGDELDHYLPPERAGEVIPQADLLMVTGVTLLNGTLEGLLEQVTPGTEVLVTGPTASVLPDPLFARGVTETGGILVTNPDQMLDLIAEGGSGYHMYGKCAERIIMRAGDDFN